VQLHAPTPAGDDLLELVHDPMYIASVKRAPDDLMGRLSLRWGLGTEDNPIFPQMHEASALVTGATVDAARSVWEGRTQHAVNISGGLHHAMRDRASGFCVYDDPASRSPGCCRRARSGSPTSTSTCTTATASRRPSTTTPA
jgi:acetoin utilization protein AcuC